MKIVKELRDKIKAEVVICLEAYRKTNELETKLIDTICAIIDEIKPPKAPPAEHTAIKYVGDVDECRDMLYDTGIWKKDEVKLVPRTIASQMFSHPTVYAPAEKTDKVKTIIDAQQVEDQKTQEEDYHRTTISVRSMTDVDAVKKFVADNYNGLKLDLPEDTAIGEYHRRALALVDQYGLPQK